MTLMSVYGCTELSFHFNVHFACYFKCKIFACLLFGKIVFTKQQIYFMYLGIPKSAFMSNFTGHSLHLNWETNI